MPELRVGMRGKVYPISFGRHYERDEHGRWVLVSKPIPCVVAAVYEKFVMLEFEGARGTKIRECFYKDDRALNVKWEEGEGDVAE